MHSLTHIFVKSKVFTTQNTLQLPLQHNAAMQTQRSIGTEFTSGEPKCNDAVSVIEVLGGVWTQTFLDYYNFLHLAFSVSVSG